MLQARKEKRDLLKKRRRERVCKIQREGEEGGERGTELLDGPKQTRLVSPTSFI